MKNIQWAFGGLLLLLTGLWLLADTLWPQPFGYFPFRHVFVQLTGVLAMGAMSVAMLLAIRPKWLEPHLNGLDKMYRLHKWLGITALVIGLVHWWWARGTKWMVGWGWLERPQRRGGGEGPQPGWLEGWLSDQRGLAETVGEWVFYAAVILIVLALVKRFPYHLFTKTHRWLALIYLALVYHALVLTSFEYWTQPLGFVLALLLVVGTWTAIVVLLRRVGINRRAQGVIESLQYYPELRVLETTLQLDERWQGHKAGQFAFATSKKHEGAHPYTIASAWNPLDRRLVFITKALGDHTSRLHGWLRTGMTVTLEGPYGCFDFSDERPRQIWVGAGIGITPFVARMKERAREPGQQIIDLFHCTADYDPLAIAKMQADAKAANVRLHVLVDGKDGRLDARRIQAAVPEWQQASLWFCGPPGFGQALRKDFLAAGMAPGDFHQELFHMR